MINDLAFIPNGRLVASAGKDITVRVRLSSQPALIRDRRHLWPLDCPGRASHLAVPNRSHQPSSRRSQSRTPLSSPSWWWACAASGFRGTVRYRQIGCLNRFDAREITSVVDGVAAVGEIEQDERVAERVSDDRQAPNCDSVRLHHDDAARGRNVGHCIRDRGDQPVRGDGRFWPSTISVSLSGSRSPPDRLRRCARSTRDRGALDKTPSPDPGLERARSQHRPSEEQGSGSSPRSPCNTLEAIFVNRHVRDILPSADLQFGLSPTVSTPAVERATAAPAQGPRRRRAPKRPRSHSNGRVRTGHLARI